MSRITFLISLEVVSAAQSSFREATRRVLAESRAMGRDLTFDVYRDPFHPDVLRIIESHPDSVAALEHFEIFGSTMRKVWATAKVTHVEVLGSPSSQLQVTLSPLHPVLKPFWFGTSGMFQ